LVLTACLNFTRPARVLKTGTPLDRYGHLFPSGDDGTELAAAEKALVAI
jgi:hypothetical protein